ncbi:Stk1 family PASTA domain-containing Ser/Thr kinase [Stackebrandtia nassauensis]|uniref:non-specific serine/threonine protein kinase n=1 Tax=Stackebrandtia nassauensis (strain DSM 44728 / CIP 108903 / NRRL B-16338 / NBRC 102104 / LLR-40K-21) TaxID=446470 RepID=D3Q5M6_STANL|nr:Stk1 family PASTA domain-containing Ser/Thr kinase [Stackebrandtia nassauensis]ADD46086.1 serine/threonine protein kinase with PASTA sensor(s) [Stackebrandtia nassauensis DSM 44728]
MTAQPRLLGGRYEIGGMIGYGGMAEVHRGRDIRLGRDVAIKMLRTDLARDETFLTRFRREAHNAATLNHPSIVAVYDTGEDTDSGVPVPYIVMEFVEGRTLKEVLTAEGRLSPRRACEILADVCAALDFSHRHQIIHRDVKPGNVMLSSNGQIKVMDFGIARALAAGQATMTQTSAVIGTAQYLSPEQARGETVDARSDVYASGCLIYELLCGEPPFTGDNPVSVAYQHVREAPIPPSHRNPDVPPSVDAITLKALEKNPINRYQSAGEMRDDLERAIAGRPVLATPVMSQEERTQLLAAQRADDTRVAPVVSDRPKKNTGKKVAAAVIALALVAGLGFLTWYLTAGDGATVAVPKVVGMKEAEAVERIEKAELKAKVEEVPSSDQEKGDVTDQDPGALKKVEKNSTVILKVGKGRTTVTVPDLSNLIGCPEMKSKLKAAELKIKCEEVSSSKDKGAFIDQQPDAGEKLKSGETVEVKVSNNDTTTVPDVSGMSEQKACKKIEEAGFSCDVSSDLQAVSDPDDAGKVVDQTPDAEAEAEKNSTVTIYIGGIQVPKLRELTVEEARDAAEEAGLEFDAGSAPDDFIVESQDPPEGEVVEDGTTVTVTAQPDIGT